MAVLGEGRVVRHWVFDAQAAEPAIGQVQPHLFAQATFRADAQAVTNDQHADHWFRVNRRATGMAIVRRQMIMQVRQIEKAVNLAQPVVLRYQIVEVERVKKWLLWLVVTAHHGEELHP